MFSTQRFRASRGESGGGGSVWLATATGRRCFGRCGCGLRWYKVRFEGFRSVRAGWETKAILGCELGTVMTGVEMLKRKKWS